MDTDMLRRIDDHIQSDSGNRLLGMTMLCGQFGKDFIFQHSVYLHLLYYGQEYPAEHGVN